MLGRNLQVLQDLRHGRKGQLALCQPLAGILQCELLENGRAQFGVRIGASDGCRHTVHQGDVLGILEDLVVQRRVLRTHFDDCTQTM